MAKHAGSAPRPGRRLGPDEALIALFIGAMNANDHVAREELARAHHRIRAEAASRIIEATLVKNHL